MPSRPARPLVSWPLLLAGLLLLPLARADEVVLKNGRSMRGRIVSEDADRVVIESGGTRVPIPRGQIDRVVRDPAGGRRAEAEPEGEAAGGGRERALPHGDRTLVLALFQGADRRVATAAARQLEETLGLRVEVRERALAPDRARERRYRRELLEGLARLLEVPVGEDLADLDRRVRAALAGHDDPRARELLARLEAQGPQLHAGVLVDQLERELAVELARPGVVGVVGLTDSDIYDDERSFLFGLAGPRAGVVSSCRFGARGEPRLAARLHKQLLSTTGFVLGVPRCGVAECARAYPNSLEEHDRKPDRPCERCRSALEAALSRPPR